MKLIALVILSLITAVVSADEINISGEYRYELSPSTDPWTGEVTEGPVSIGNLAITQDGSEITMQGKKYTFHGRINGNEFVAESPVLGEHYDGSKPDVQREITAKGRVRTIRGRIVDNSIVDASYNSYWVRWEDGSLTAMKYTQRTMVLFKLCNNGELNLNTLKDALRAFKRPLEGYPAPVYIQDFYVGGDVQEKSRQEFLGHYFHTLENRIKADHAILLVGELIENGGIPQWVILEVNAVLDELEINTEKALEDCDKKRLLESIYALQYWSDNIQSIKERERETFLDINRFSEYLKTEVDYVFKTRPTNLAGLVTWYNERPEESVGTANDAATSATSIAAYKNISELGYRAAFRQETLKVSGGLAEKGWTSYIFSRVMLVNAIISINSSLREIGLLMNAAHAIEYLPHVMEMEARLKGGVEVGTQLHHIVEIWANTVLPELADKMD